jgi:hypothetical protein
VKVHEHKEGNQERLILAGMINNSGVCGPLAAVWPEYGPGPFEASDANVIGSWCAAYYRKHNRAPGEDINNLFAVWIEESQPDQATQDAYDRLLSEICQNIEIKHFQVDNTDHVMDIAGRHLQRVKVNRALAAASGHLAMNRTEAAVESLSTALVPFRLGPSARIKPYTDRFEVVEPFREDRFEPLFEYPGALGDFFTGMLRRDEFLLFLAPEKAGKTWFLVDLAFRAMCQRRRVAFFELGDNSKNQLKLRLYVRASRHPIYSPTGTWPCRVPWPKAVTLPKFSREPATVEYGEDLVFDGPLTEEIAWETCQEIQKWDVRSRDSYFGLHCSPQKILGVAGIRSTLKAWEMEDGWVPDVLILDYADILAPPNSRMDPRQVIDENFSQLRALNTELHCLLVTATQADAASYSQWTLHRGNFSNDKRKHAYITGEVGINTSGEEKGRRLIRLNWIQQRDRYFEPGRCCHLAHCFDVGNPAVVSAYEPRGGLPRRVGEGDQE